MATFVMRGTYPPEVVKQISSERNVRGYQILQECGATNVSVYATMGEDDILVLADFPGIHEAMKASVSLTRELGISFDTVPALPIDDFDALVGK